MAPWPSGKAKVCNTSIPGPIPGGASKKDRTPNGVLSFLVPLTLIGAALRACAQNPVRIFDQTTIAACEQSCGQK